jgi:hypothetical protein
VANIVAADETGAAGDEHIGHVSADPFICVCLRY